ncbi:MAG TPA: beta-L-arabinofuranosidase domain-containing protein, partial [Tepidisphaeraceae bacterium]|nr:beta-L-arabinofuranosidase domain-containing protein [Tepidisphaeraceae bacterium]
INLATGDATAIDELERILYNGALSGVSLAGNTYFYENPLQAGPKRTRWAWHACPCCPPMFLKLMSALPGYIYATGDQSALYVNLFIGSQAKLTLADTPVAITQTTHYPWTGDVRLTISPAHAAKFDMNIRIPDWCRESSSPGGLYTWHRPAGDAFSISVNGQPIATPEITRGYAHVSHTWSAGDVLELHLSMPPRRVVADEHVKADRGRVALMRGPLVYCLESIDNGGSLHDLKLPEDSPIAIEERPTLLGAVTVLHASRYRPTSDNAAAQSQITAIPYYANANRGPVEMEVWIPANVSGVH